MEIQEVLENSKTMDASVSFCGNGSVQPNAVKDIENPGDDILEDLDIYLDIQVSDSVIRAMVNAVEQEAAEKISQKESKVARLKEAVRFFCLGVDENESSGSSTVHHDKKCINRGLYSSTLDTLLEHDRVRESLASIRNAVEEELKKLKKDVKSLSSSHLLRIHRRRREAINDKILSLKYEDYLAETDSHEKGVIVLVTGCLTVKDNVRRKFTQTFFLAPQENGYFLLNDVFRYVEENESLQTNSVLVNSINDNAQTAALTPEPGPTHAPDHLVVDPETSCGEENVNNGDEVCSPLDNGEGSLDNGEGSVIDVEIVEPPTHSSQDQILTGADSTPAAQGDASKISYASIMSSLSLLSLV